MTSAASCTTGMSSVSLCAAWNANSDPRIVPKSSATFKTSWNTAQPSRQQTLRKPQGNGPFGIRRATGRAMMPGGHLATSIALGGVAYASTGSLEAAVGCFAGGFLIDVDHYGDYLIFEKQWRRPGPLSFLRYYFAHRPKKIVLPLHSA